MVFHRVPMNPQKNLDALIHAGLGDVDQNKITKAQLLQARLGLQVHPTRDQKREYINLRKDGPLDGHRWRE